MIKLPAGLLAGLFAAAALPALADDSAIREALQTLLPDAGIDSIAETPLPGIYEVSLGGQVVYVSGDGNYLLQGSMYDVRNKVDLTERKRNVARKAALAQVPRDKRIIFEPEEVKHRITVFTDIDCGYCRRLHQEMADYNARGIAVEYLFFPRAGLGSESFQKAVNVWCAPDRKVAMTRAKAGETLEKRECETPIAENYAFVPRIGLDGATPTMVAEDGTVLPGYLPADALLQRLDGLRQVAATDK